MKLILVINSGSSSMKFQLIDIENNKKIIRGVVEKIGTDRSCYRIVDGTYVERYCAEVENHSDAVGIALDYLLTRSSLNLKSLNELDGVGHRVVQGGSLFKEAALVTKEVKEKIAEYAIMAPLHNYANLAGIEACEKLMPGIPQVVVFDTTFHQSMPEYAYQYGLPYEYYEKYGLRKYGAHGTSHKYVSENTAQRLDLVGKDFKMIVCHLGNGSSISAIKNGKVVDTSMGFTPLEGLMMGTRCGDIDPAAVLFLMKNENLTADEMDYILNKKSGILGVSGVSNDMRDLEVAMKAGNERAHLAHDMFVYRIIKIIGSYVTVLNGLDVLVFTAGIGENIPLIRRLICESLEFMGVEIDSERNVNCTDGEISASTSKVKVLVVPTDEEMEIAKETEDVVSKL